MEDNEQKHRLLNRKKSNSAKQAWKKHHYNYMRGIRQRERDNMKTSRDIKDESLSIKKLNEEKIHYNPLIDERFAIFTAINGHFNEFVNSYSTIEQAKYGFDRLIKRPTSKGKTYVLIDVEMNPNGIKKNSDEDWELTITTKNIIRKYEVSEYDEYEGKYKIFKENLSIKKLNEQLDKLLNEGTVFDYEPDADDLMADEPADSKMFDAKTSSKAFWQLTDNSHFPGWKSLDGIPILNLVSDYGFYSFNLAIFREKDSDDYTVVVEGINDYVIYHVEEPEVKNILNNPLFESATGLKDLYIPEIGYELLDKLHHTA